MGLFRSFKGPVFLKKSKRLSEEYEYLKELSEKNNNLELKYKLKIAECALKSEDNIIQVLKSSHIPMFVLQDVNLSYGKFKARIDFILITKFNVYVIETKDMYGKLKVDHKGNFTREYTASGKNCTEELPSPIERSKRNMDVLKIVGYENKKMVEKIVFDKLFYTYYKPLIVLGSHKTSLDDKEISDNIKDKIIRVECLVNYIEENDNQSKNKFSKREMDKIAQNILDKHLEEIIFYDIIYKEYNNELDISKDELEHRLEKELRKYRYYIASRMNKKVINVFSDKALKQLVKEKPTNKKDLSDLKIINKHIAEKYGNKIIDIINKYV